MRVRRHREHASLAKKAAAAIVAALDAAEVWAANVRNAVVFREPLVDEGVICRQQIEHAAIFAQDAAREQLRFAAEPLPEILIEVALTFGVRKNGREISQK